MNELPATFPTLQFSENQVDPKKHVEKGTSSTKVGCYILAAILILILAASTVGMIFLSIPVVLLIDYLNSKKAMAILKGSAVEVGPDQFPELHHCAQTFARRLGMKQPPQIFIVESNVINAAAMSIGSRQVVVLVDDIVDACLRSGDPKAIGFILGHEMAHHALGHTGLIQGIFLRSYAKLSRLNEFSCDSVARALVADDSVALNALLVLLTGPQLGRYVNRTALLKQAQEVENDKNSLKAERLMRLSHPLLLRRLGRILKS